MTQLIWRFERSVLDEESVVRPVFEHLFATPGFDPVEYDLNQREDWRDLDVDRLVVDALTQRTQLVRVRGADDALIIVAMGKHDEQPTAMLRSSASPDVAALTGRWTELYEALPLGSTAISDRDWRHAVLSGGIGADAGESMVAMALGWARDHVPFSPDALRSDLSGESPVELVDEGNHLALILATSPEFASDEHRRDVRRVYRVLMQG